MVVFCLLVAAGLFALEGGLRFCAWLATGAPLGFGASLGLGASFGFGPSGHQPASRDDTYYMQDGSCILRVENTLFNVRLPFLYSELD